jgi:haloalkane dehalogenase
VSATASAPLPTARRRYVDVPWGQVHVREAGPAAGGPLLLLLHQTPLSSRTYAPVLGHLGAVAHVVAPDTAGYGASDPPPQPWTVPDYAAAVWHLVDALGRDDVVLLGQHTGAVLAVEATRQQPQRVRGVVLHGVPVYTDEEREERLRSYAPPYEIAPDGSHLATIWARQRRLYPRQDPDDATGYVQDYLATGPDYATAYRAVFRYDIAQHLPAVASHPVLLLCGELDLVHHHHLRAAQRLPHAREVTLRGCTDFAPAEAPERFAAEVATFLRSLGDPAPTSAQR